MGLEERVIEKLREVDDTTLDRIARAYARNRFPSRFSWVEGLGVNDEGQPIGGRPDAFVRASDDTLDRIETTRHASKSQVRNKAFTRGHFPTILTNIRRSGVGGGLVYVAGHPKIQFTPQDIANMTDAAVAAGLKRERVHIVGGDALADALCQPELAGARIRLLGIGDPKQFALVRRELSPDQRRLARPGTPNPFIPTADDLDADTVHFPILGTEVERRLREQRICLVRGLGASGKSVLAWLVGLRWGRFGDPAYVVNLQTIADVVQVATRECIEDLKLFGAPNALFIVDNCHLEDEAARKIYLAWDEIQGTRPALLLLGRETRNRLGSRMDGLDLEPLVLRAQQREVFGVFQRLAARHLRKQGDSTAPPNPRGEVLDSWVSTFGGDPALAETTTDLIAFSAAVQRRIKQLLCGDWALADKDAAEEILNHYIRPLSGAERHNLYRLSVFQKIEMELADRLLFDTVEGLSTCTDKLGIVFARERGLSRLYRHYQLAHPALGNLILRAADDFIDEANTYKAAAAVSGFDALTLLVRLKAAGRDSDVAAVRNVMLANPQLLAQLSPSYWKWFLSEVRECSDPVAFETFTKSLAAPDLHTALVQTATSSPLNDLAASLRYLERSDVPEFRSLHQSLAGKLAKESLLPALVKTAAAAPLNDLAGFLRYLEQSEAPEFRTLHPTLAAKFAEESQLPALLTRAVSSPMSFLADFLRYLERSTVPGFRTLHKTIASELSDESKLTELVKTAAKSPLHFLTDFLRYLEQSKVPALRTLHQTMASKLSSESQLAELVKTAARSPLHFLSGFLRYLEQSRLAVFRGLFPAILRELGTPDVSTTLATTALQAPADELEGFINFVNGRELFDPFISNFADHCSEKGPHSEVMARRAEAMVMEADLWFGHKSHQSSIEHLRRVEAIFGTSMAKSVQDVTNDALLMRASLHAAVGDSDLALDALTRCKQRGMANLRANVERDSRFAPILNTPKFAAFLASVDQANSGTLNTLK